MKLPQPRSIRLGSWRGWLVHLILHVSVVGAIALGYGSVHPDFAGYLTTGDSRAYLLGAEYLFQHGEYALCPEGPATLAALPPAWRTLGGYPVNDPACRASRLPGYVPWYLMLRWALSPPELYVGLVWLQLIASATAAWFVGVVVRRVRTSQVGWGVGVALALCPFTAAFDVYLLSESFSTSLVLTGLACGVLALASTHRSLRWAIAAGAALVWAAFLRPVYLPLPVLLAVVLLPKNGVNSASIRLGIATLTVPLIALTGWSIRNAVVLDRFVPLLSTRYGGGPQEPPPAPRAPQEPPPSFDAMISLLWVWGGNPLQWFPEAEMAFFEDGLPIERNPESASVLPSWVAESVPLDTLLALRRDFRTAEETALPYHVRAAADSRAVALATRLRAQAWQKHPLEVAVIRPTILQWRLLRQMPAYYVVPMSFAEAGIGLRALIVGAWLYYLAVWAAVGWALLRWLRRWDAVGLWLLLAAGYLLTVYPWVLRAVEPRFLTPAIPVLVMLAGVMAVNSIKAKRPRGEDVS